MGNKRTRRYNKRKRRTRKYGGENSPSTKSDASSRGYFGNPYIDNDIEEQSNISSIPDSSSNADTSNYMRKDRSNIPNNPL